MRTFQVGVIGFAVLVSGLLISAQAPQPPAAGQGPVAQPAPAGRQGGARGGGRGRGAQVRIRKTLLAWADTRNGQSQHAFTSHALAIVERMGYESGLWDTFIRTDSNIVANTAFKTDGTPASGGPSLSNTDGIFFLGHREIDINPKQREELSSLRAQRQRLRRRPYGVDRLCVVARVRRNARRAVRRSSLYGSWAGHQRAAELSGCEASGGHVQLHGRVLSREDLLARQDGRVAAVPPAERSRHREAGSGR